MAFIFRAGWNEECVTEEWKSKMYEAQEKQGGMCNLRKDKAANENFVVKGEGYAASFSFHNTSFFARKLDFMSLLKTCSLELELAEKSRACRSAFFSLRALFSILPLKSKSQPCTRSSPPSII
ncbi:hypothetical protein [Saccharibacillus sacchari]|uniref:Uncharacterized protein n=1 Tax=Saccharibacillus sacchari TaxID=456493 RepID=A0ACC6PC57_9BACL